MTARPLAEVDIEPAGSGFALRLTTADGNVIEFSASRDLLDHLADLLDDALLSDEEGAAADRDPRRRG